MKYNMLEFKHSESPKTSIYDATIEIHRRNIEENFLENIDCLIDERLTILKECGITTSENSYKDICRELELLFRRAADTYIVM